MDCEDQNNENKKIRSIERALNVLLCFTVETPALSMTEISEMVGIHKSTVHRILATLESKNFVRREPETGVYRLGFRLLQMANLSLADVNIRHFSLPYMRLLNEEFRENVDLAIVDRDEVLFIDTFESTQPVKLAVSPGQHLPAYNSASGKAILAFLPNEEALRIIKKHNHDIETQNQLKLEAFLEDLRVTRDRGYALDCESLEVGVNAVAAPIFGLKNKPIASLAIAGPAYRLDCELMQKMGEKLIATNLEITKKILQAS